jgi:hypothetical protein
LKTPYYSYGIKNIKLSVKQSILIASREKAVLDKVILTPRIHLRSIKQTKELLLEDLRLDVDELRSLDSIAMESWIEDAPKKNSLKMLVETLRAL